MERREGYDPTIESKKGVVTNYQEPSYVTIGKEHPEEPEDFRLYLEDGEFILFKGKGGALLDMLPMNPKSDIDWFPTRSDLAVGIYGEDSPANVRKVTSLVGSLRMELDPFGWYIFYEKPEGGDQKGYHLSEFHRNDEPLPSLPVVPTTTESPEAPAYDEPKVLTRHTKVAITIWSRSANEFLDEYSEYEDKILGNLSLQDPSVEASQVTQGSYSYSRKRSRRHRGIPEDNLSAPEAYFKEKEK